MILLAGIASESPMAAVADAAEALGARVEWFHQRHATQYEVDIDVTGGRLCGRLASNAAKVDFAQVTGVYLRMMDMDDLPELSGRKHDGSLRASVHLTHEKLVQWTEWTDALVLNRHSAMASNGSKPYQAQRIASVGFLVPETLITNDPDLVHAFRRQHGRVIFKSTSSVRSIVRELTDDNLSLLGRVRSLPTQFQEHVEGVDVRVHVVGTRVFATEITSQAIDYRYAGRDGEAIAMQDITLPTEIEQRCVELSALLDLPLCGIDLRRTRDGRYFCFEVNPSPAYTFYEEQTGQPIADAIARLLVHGDACKS